MMTKIEMEYMNAVIQMNRRQRINEPDWEQRRYEIAREAMKIAPTFINHNLDVEALVQKSVEIADALVAELIRTEKADEASL